MTKTEMLIILTNIYIARSTNQRYAAFLGIFGIIIVSLIGMGVIH